jgi:hypothetical protein
MVSFRYPLEMQARNCYKHTMIEIVTNKG